MSSISKTIYINNGCGQLFIFKDIANDVEEWFEANKIYDVVNNNFSSCEWGIHEKLTVVEAPDDGWIKPVWCDVGEHFVPACDMWPDFADCRNCCSEKDYLSHTSHECELDEFGCCVHCCECKECIKMLEQDAETST